MYGSFLSYLITYLLGALSLYLYQIYSKKSKPTYQPRTLPTFGQSPVAKAPEAPKKPDQADSKDGLTVISSNSKVLVPLADDSSTTNKENDKKGDDEDQKSREKARKEKGKEKEDDTRRGDVARKSSTMREARRYSRPPVLQSQDRSDGNIVIGYPYKRNQSDPAFDQMEEKSASAPSTPSLSTAGPAPQAGEKGSTVKSTIPPAASTRNNNNNGRDLLTQSMPAVKTTTHVQPPIPLPIPHKTSK